MVGWHLLGEFFWGGVDGGDVLVYYSIVTRVSNGLRQALGWVAAPLMAEPTHRPMTLGLVTTLGAQVATGGRVYDRRRGYDRRTGCDREFPVLISIDPSNGLPIYEQIVRQVKFNVASGALAPGQQVPSVRELAKQLALNPNTIQRAYQLLQSDSVLETIRGRGQVVSPGARRQCLDQRLLLIRERLGLVIEEALRAGLEDELVREEFESALQRHRRPSKSSGASDEKELA